MKLHTRFKVTAAIVGLAIAATGCAASESESTTSVAAETPATSTTQPAATTTTPVPTTASPEPTVATLGWTTTEELDRLHNPDESCFGFDVVHSAGLVDFATISNQLTSRDLQTGAITEHGTPPAPCAVWLGDEDLGLWWAGSEDALHAFFGKYGESWDVEKEWETPTWLEKSQYTASGRLVFVNDDNEVFLTDGETGETIGAPVGNGRFESVDSSATLPYVALSFGVSDSGEGSGLLYLLDDRTGEVVHEVTTQLPAQALVFDDDANQLVAGLAGGNVVTIDLETGSAVSEVETTARTSFLDIGIQADGMVIAVSNGQIDIVDRNTGTTAAGDIDNGHGARIRSGGTPLVLDDTSIRVYAPGAVTTPQQASAVYDGAGCTYEGPTDVSAGTKVRFTFTNESDTTEVTFGIFRLAEGTTQDQILAMGINAISNGDSIMNLYAPSPIGTPRSDSVTFEDPGLYGAACTDFSGDENNGQGLTYVAMIDVTK